MSESDSMARLGTPACLAFPFRVGAAGPAVSRGADYVREQIEQVLFTTPGERVFRSEFGAGVKTLTFEPNNQPLWEVTRRRILAALTAVVVIAGAALAANMPPAGFFPGQSNPPVAVAPTPPLVSWAAPGRLTWPALAEVSPATELFTIASVD